jgi:hypothetical protein
MQAAQELNCPLCRTYGVQLRCAALQAFVSPIILPQPSAEALHKESSEARSCDDPWASPRDPHPPVISTNPTADGMCMSTSHITAAPKAQLSIVGDTACSEVCNGLGAASAVRPGHMQPTYGATLKLPVPSEGNLTPQLRPATNSSQPNLISNREMPPHASTSSWDRLHAADAMVISDKQPHQITVKPAFGAPGGPDYAPPADASDKSEAHWQKLMQMSSAEASSTPAALTVPHMQGAEMLSSSSLESTPTSHYPLGAPAQRMCDTLPVRQPQESQLPQITIPSESGDSRCSLDLLRAQMYAANAASFHSQLNQTRARGPGLTCQEDSHTSTREARVECSTAACAPEKSQSPSVVCSNGTSHAVNAAETSSCSEVSTKDPVSAVVHASGTSNHEGKESGAVICSAEQGMTNTQHGITAYIDEQSERAKPALQGMIPGTSAAAAISCLLQEDSIVLDDSPMAFVSPASGKGTNSALVGVSCSLYLDPGFGLFVKLVDVQCSL